MEQELEKLVHKFNKLVYRISEFEELLEIETNPENLIIITNELDDMYESYLDFKKYLLEQLENWYLHVQLNNLPVSLKLYSMLKRVRVNGK